MIIPILFTMVPCVIMLLVIGASFYTKPNESAIAASETLQSIHHIIVYAIQIIQGPMEIIVITLAILSIIIKPMINREIKAVPFAMYSCIAAMTTVFIGEYIQFYQGLSLESMPIDMLILTYIMSSIAVFTMVRNALMENSQIDKFLTSSN